MQAKLCANECAFGILKRNAFVSPFLKIMITSVNTSHAVESRVCTGRSDTYPSTAELLSHIILVSRLAMSPLAQGSVAHTDPRAAQGVPPSSDLRRHLHSFWWYQLEGRDRATRLGVRCPSAGVLLPADGTFQRVGLCSHFTMGPNVTQNRIDSMQSVITAHVSGLIQKCDSALRT